MVWYNMAMTSKKIRTTVIVPDVQYPFHDALALKKIVKVIEDVQPHQVVQIGDGIDFPQVSQWSVGTAGAYATDLQSHVQGYRKDFLAEVRERAPQARLRWLEGNHDLRVMSFIKKYAPALASLDALSMPSLFSLDELGWTYEKGPINIGTNVYAIHGHECGGYSSTISAWDTKFAKRYGSHRSYVFGHTHQPGIVTRAFGFEGKVDPRFTMNVGSVMDPVQATYVKDGAVSWQMSFGVLHDDGKRVYPELITMTDRGFVYAGSKY